MKVLMCIPTLQSAGAERFVTELAVNIKLLNANVIVVTTNSLSNTEFYKTLKSNNIEVKDVSSNNYFKTFRNINRLLKEEKPDIVHTNIGSMLYMLVPTILYRRAKHLFTVHSMGYRIFSGLKEKIAKYVFTHNAVKAIAICDTVKNSICDTYNLQVEKVQCIYNGVDTNKFKKTTESRKNKIQFVTTGTLYKVKNHRMIIDALKKVKNKYKNVELTIIGDGELRQALEEQVFNNNLSENVKFVGKQGNVKKFLDDADIYLCSSIVEGLPLAVMEAMSMNLPIITTPAGGVIDIVIDNVNGFIVPHNDSESMASAMINLIENESLRKEMGKISREIACKHDITICAKEYLKLYNLYKK